MLTQYRLLYCVSLPLMPANTGAKQRMLGFLRYLKSRRSAINVDILVANPYGEKLWDEQQLGILRDYCDRCFVYHGEQQFFDLIHSRSQSLWHQKILRQQLPVDTDYYTPPGYQRFAKQILRQRQYDFLWINYLEHAPIAWQVQDDRCQTILDMHDLSCRSRLARRNLDHLKGLQFDYERNFQREIRALQRFDWVLANSAEEVAEIQAEVNPEKLRLVPHLLNNVAEVEHLPVYQQRHHQYDLLFVGAAYGPNIDGMQIFIDKIFPKILAQAPTTQLAIAGNISNHLVIPSSLQTNIHLLGFVTNLSDVYLSSKVVICPLWSGSGTKVKLQEAMAYHIPIVTTTVGASGLMLEQGVNVLISDQAEQFATQTLLLLSTVELRQQFSASLSQSYAKHYSQEAVYNTLDAMLKINVPQNQLLQNQLVQNQLFTVKR
jgi:glycosyltransferase involved in cell wall biosynthesis